MARLGKRRNRRKVEELLKSRLTGTLLSLEGPHTIAGHSLWSAETSEGKKFILIDGDEARILDGNSGIETAILAVAELRGMFTVERTIYVVGAAIGLGLLIYTMVRAVVLGFSEISVSSFALFFGAAGMLSAVGSLWLKIRSSELQILLESGQRLKVDRDGVSRDEIKRLSKVPTPPRDEKGAPGA